MTYESPEHNSKACIQTRIGSQLLWALRLVFRLSHPMVIHMTSDRLGLVGYRTYLGLLRSSLIISINRGDIHFKQASLTGIV